MSKAKKEDHSANSHDISNIDSISDEEGSVIKYTHTMQSQMSQHHIDDSGRGFQDVFAPSEGNFEEEKSAFNQEERQSERSSQYEVSEIASNLGDVENQIGFVLALSSDEAIGICIPSCQFLYFNYSNTKNKDKKTFSPI
jgi:hypothetical protein